MRSLPSFHLHLYYNLVNTYNKIWLIDLMNIPFIIYIDQSLKTK